MGRQFVVDTLARWGVRDEPGGARVDEIVLVTSELLTNAVHASPGTAGLRIQAHRDHVLVEVRDTSAAPTVVRDAGPGDTGGRGLAIVNALSDGWGSTPSLGPGKVVWSKMAIATPAALSEHCRL